MMDAGAETGALGMSRTHLEVELCIRYRVQLERPQYSAVRTYLRRVQHLHQGLSIERERGHERQVHAMDIGPPGHSLGHTGRVAIPPAVDVEAGSVW